MIYPCSGIQVSNTDRYSNMDATCCTISFIQHSRSKTIGTEIWAGLPGSEGKGGEERRVTTKTQEGISWGDGKIISWLWWWLHDSTCCQKSSNYTLKILRSTACKLYFNLSIQLCISSLSALRIGDHRCKAAILGMWVTPNTQTLPWAG